MAGYSKLWFRATVTFTATGSDKKCLTRSVICATITAKQTVSRKIHMTRLPFSRFSSVAARSPEIFTWDKISRSFIELRRFTELLVAEEEIVASFSRQIVTEYEPWDLCCCCCDGGGGGLTWNHWKIIKKLKKKKIIISFCKIIKLPPSHLQLVPWHYHGTTMGMEVNCSVSTDMVVTSSNRVENQVL